jgi:repressor LexA
MSFGNNLKKIRQEHDMTQEELAKRINTSRSNIANYENDKNMPSIEILNKLSEILNCSTDYLLGKSDTRINISNIDESDKKFYMCPVYGQISAGQPNWAEECIEGRLPIDPDLMGIVNPEEHFFLRVNGESMNKVVRNGAFALIHKQDVVEDGEIAVVLVNGYDATLKKFTRQGDMIILEPESNDDSFKTQVYDKTTQIKILGKYVGKMEINK